MASSFGARPISELAAPVTAGEPGPAKALPAQELGRSFVPGRWHVRQTGYGATQTPASLATSSTMPHKLPGRQLGSRGCAHRAARICGTRHRSGPPRARPRRLCRRQRARRQGHGAGMDTTFAHASANQRRQLVPACWSAGAVDGGRLLRRQCRNRGQHGGAEVPVDPNHVLRGCRVLAATVRGGQVIAHHGYEVTPGLTCAAGRQQPQFPRAPHGRGAVTDLELGVDAAQVRADGVRRDGQFAGDLWAG